MVKTSFQDYPFFESKTWENFCWKMIIAWLILCTPQYILLTHKSSCFLKDVKYLWVNSLILLLKYEATACHSFHFWWAYDVLEIVYRFFFLLNSLLNKNKSGKIRQWMEKELLACFFFTRESFQTLYFWMKFSNGEFEKMGNSWKMEFFSRHELYNGCLMYLVA